MALACDIRISSDDAKMGLVETKLAIIPGLTELPIREHKADYHDELIGKNYRRRGNSETSSNCGAGKMTTKIDAEDVPEIVW